MTAPTPEAAGQALTKACPDIIETDTDALLALADQLDTRADALEELAVEAHGAAEALPAAAKAWKGTYDPYNAHGAVVATASSNHEMFADQLHLLAVQRRSDANALRWIAEATERTEDENAAAVAAIDADVQPA